MKPTKKKKNQKEIRREENSRQKKHVRSFFSKEGFVGERVGNALPRETLFFDSRDQLHGKDLKEAGEQDASRSREEEEERETAKTSAKYEIRIPDLVVGEEVLIHARAGNVFVAVEVLDLVFRLHWRSTGRNKRKGGRKEREDWMRWCEANKTRNAKKRRSV
jgi:hypothetical protein